MSKDWSWKPDESEKPKYYGKKKKNRGRNKKRRSNISRKSNDSFYSSVEWRELRVRVLEKYDCKCMMCGRSPKYHNVVLNVDHIKPRRKFPDLALCFDNLQVLCGACNHGKGNKYETDHRPSDEYIEQLLDEVVLKRSPI